MLPDSPQGRTRVARACAVSRALAQTQQDDGR
jgi:hypothetical protein